MIKVMLVDDHAVVRTGFRRLLEASGKIDVVAEAEDGNEACQLEARYEPHVVVMDLSLRGMGGLEAIRRIKQRGSRSKILVFSMYDNALLAERALQAGASGYLTKNSSSAHMVDAVSSVARGKRYLGRDIAESLAFNRVAGDESPINALSQREFEVFRLLVEGNSTGTIAATLHLTGKTVANYLCHIKEKLDVTSTTELIHVAIRHGLLKMPVE